MLHRLYVFGNRNAMFYSYSIFEFLSSGHVMIESGAQTLVSIVYEFVMR